ncbi:MAG: hypothetical protein GX876_04910 [Bacteroidales bacterium]|nr:hypothetical protein [Bacteroidales bacterium]
MMNKGFLSDKDIRFLKPANYNPINLPAFPDIDMVYSARNRSLHVFALMVFTRNENIRDE